jgi:DNA-binding transcriptional MerR regulator
MSATATALGVSYRRLDYWTRRGYLKPDGNGLGSGYWRRWPDDELAVAALMARLVGAGLVLDVAAKIARAAIESGQLTHYVLLADAVYLSVVVDVVGK